MQTIYLALGRVCYIASQTNDFASIFIYRIVFAKWAVYRNIE